jgi:cytochrome c-type biogenesis protein CcmH/NrfF
MIVGTIIALLPERALAFATSRVPSGAVPTSLLLVAALTVSGSQVSAQHIEQPQTTMVVPKTALEKDLQGHLVCMCGTCGRKLIGECTCPLAAEMRQKVGVLVSQGKNRDEVIQAFVTEWGSQEVLAEPIDRGFNRLAWLLPYGVGALGVVVVGGVAMRWSRRRDDGAVEPTLPAAPSALQERLDDELRELD